MPAIVLASASPRRAELLGQLGVTFSVAPADIDETPLNGESPRDYVIRMAEEKARVCFQRLGGGKTVIGSDTSVVLGDRILGKPADPDDAREMLRALSGRSHQVMTAVAVVKDGWADSTLVITDVHFRVLAADEVDAYVETGESLDKAGSYGIQGRGGVFVDRIEGSYSAVVGLPLTETAKLLQSAGFPVWQMWQGAGQGSR
ncbi:Maf family protein [Marinobacter zhejiangensis]|uniref:dTTP/UTP pyrophosphatase n=1 Tax=Marinobacter zhejiangensis TaxID=488535 RepID=A0A1I4QLB7_9GAMM|nr:nucleoside triphosphate pyrophosphatase [Marinobacter zhejiangensis]SFM40841.1 septum formation protein [Marinobacter zhejiangensis]